MINKQIFLTFLVLFFSILFFELSNVNFYIQDMFYEQQTHTWILQRSQEPYKFIFYDGIKTLLILVALSFLIAIIFFRKNATVQAYKRGIYIVVFSAVLVSALVGELKKQTNMPCPKNEIHYGGEYPSTKVWQSYPKSFVQTDKIRCWPAGHASGGFALMSLFFLFKTKRNKNLALVSVITIAWSMGLYKMLIGDHFLGHTVVTMILAWLIILLVKKSVYSLSKTSTKPNSKINLV